MEFAVGLIYYRTAVAYKVLGENTKVLTLLRVAETYGIQPSGNMGVWLRG